MQRVTLWLIATLFVFVGAARSGPLGVTIQDWHYDKAKAGSELTINLLNSSHKDITAFAIRIVTSYADGTSTMSESNVDLLPGIISQHEHPELPQEAPFAPGAVYHFTKADSQAIEHVDATMQLVAFTDGTADVQNQQSLDHLIASRQGVINGLKQADEVISAVLADPNEKHPAATIKAKLDKLQALNSVDSYDGLGLSAASGMIQQATVYPDERQYLQGLIAAHQFREAQTEAHTKLTREVQP